MKIYLAIATSLSLSTIKAANAANVEASPSAVNDALRGSSSSSLSSSKHEDDADQNDSVVASRSLHKIQQQLLDLNQMECIPHPNVSEDVLCTFRINPATIGGSSGSTMVHQHNGCTYLPGTSSNVCLMADVANAFFPAEQLAPPPPPPTTTVVSPPLVIGDGDGSTSNSVIGRIDSGGKVGTGGACTTSSQCIETTFCGENNRCMSMGSCYTTEDCVKPDNIIYARPCNGGYTLQCRGVVCEKACN